jgi:magnesium-transporting ATPase (P-type)
MAKNALRVLACGYKVLNKVPSHEEMKDIEKDLTFIRNVCNDRPSKT